MRRIAILAALAAICAGPVAAGEADVVDVVATKQGGDRYEFSVTLRHADEGWDHYADAWEVLSLDRKALGTRTLYHPHVNEQPFTRSLSGVAVGAGTTVVIIRAHDKAHGYGGREMRVKLP